MGLCTPCILGIDFLMSGYFRDPWGHQWAFDTITLEMTEDTPLLNCLTLSKGGGLRTAADITSVVTGCNLVHWWQCWASTDLHSPVHGSYQRSGEFRGNCSNPFTIQQPHLASVKVQWGLEINQRCNINLERSSTRCLNYSRNWKQSLLLSMCLLTQIMYFVFCFSGPWV